MAGMLASQNWSWFEAISSDLVEEKTSVVYNFPPFENWHYLLALIPEKTKSTMRQNLLVFSFCQIISVPRRLQVGKEICLHSRVHRNARGICWPPPGPLVLCFSCSSVFLQDPDSPAGSPGEGAEADSPAQELFDIHVLWSILLRELTEGHPQQSAGLWRCCTTVFCKQERGISKLLAQIWIKPPPQSLDPALSVPQLSLYSNTVTSLAGSHTEACRGSLQVVELMQPPLHFSHPPRSFLSHWCICEGSAVRIHWVRHC